MRHLLMISFALSIVLSSALLSEARGGSGSVRELLQEEKDKAKSKKKGAGEKKTPRDAPKDAPRKGAGESKSSGQDLHASGTLKEVKGTPFYVFDYTATEGKKQSKKSAFVRLEGGADFYTDKVIKVSDLKQGDTIWLLGNPVENETRGGPNGFGGIDRQLKNVLAIAKGDGLSVNKEYKDPKDPNAHWCEASVVKAGESIDVQYQGGKYKVIMGKGATVLLREKAGDAKSIKSGVQVEVTGEKIEEKPETKNTSDAKKESFAAKKVVILDRRLLTVLYPALNG